MKRNTLDDIAARLFALDSDKQDKQQIGVNLMCFAIAFIKIYIYLFFIFLFFFNADHHSLVSKQ